MEDVFGNRIVFADQDQIALYGIEMQSVLAAIAVFMSDDPEKWLKSVWVSDSSSMGDFGLEDAEVAVVGEVLGVPVGSNDDLWRIAKSIHGKEM